MWLFTRYGFYSVVQARLIVDGRIEDQVDPDNFMVRARVRDHLVNLQNVFPALQDYPILTSPDNDYRYRTIVPKRTWSYVALELTEDVDYDNFKEACVDVDSADGLYTEALVHVWTIHSELQWLALSMDPGCSDSFFGERW